MSSTRQVIINAANLCGGSNPPYSSADFLAMYPQFAERIPEAVLQAYLGLANASLEADRWGDAWTVGMSLFVAHFVTLYMQTMASPESSAAKVLAAGEAKGLKTSKSVDGVSVSYDYGTIAQDLDGWAAWKLTQFGLQFASMAQLMGKGGAVIW